MARFGGAQTSLPCRAINASLRAKNDEEVEEANKRDGVQRKRGVGENAGACDIAQSEMSSASLISGGGW